MMPVYLTILSTDESGPWRDAADWMHLRSPYQKQ